jgi:hypothetical protein
MLLEWVKHCSEESWLFRESSEEVAASVAATYSDGHLEPSEVLGSERRIITLRDFGMFYRIKLFRAVRTMQRYNQMLLTV